MLPRDVMGGLAKGLSVIETFSLASPRQSISDVSEKSGLDRATARRCLLTLAHLGYAEYDGKFFTLTPRILRLGTACLASMPLPQMVQPLLDDLSDELGESSSVSILDKTEIVYVARAAQKRVMSVGLMAGSRLPAYCTSMGRILLAALPKDEALEVLNASTLVARTMHSKAELSELVAELDRVRSQGYAVVNQEVELGLISLAVPLQNARGKTVAAINIGASAAQYTVEQMVDRFAKPLQSVQADLRAMLH